MLQFNCLYSYAIKYPVDVQSVAFTVQSVFKMQLGLSDITHVKQLDFVIS
jgi:hypothetical protein